MLYTLDTEFNGFGGELISLALVREDNTPLYIIYNTKVTEPWVKENVVPILRADKIFNKDVHFVETLPDGADIIAEFLKGDDAPYIISDWPDDIAYFCKAIIKGPGQMAKINRVMFDVIRCYAYPTALPDMTQHNALCDAYALKHKLSIGLPIKFN